MNHIGLSYPGAFTAFPASLTAYSAGILGSLHIRPLSGHRHPTCEFAFSAPSGRNIRRMKEASC